ncbi:unnamed protein product [Echinostoma caproni]|uniref:Myosin motor domain-containing protein n=1 Tax=Echinostoma caproni TaxID=27848 RepID=A0A183AL45_9TREM|nr:unnamed protein product [Echinostoma caproni]
MYAVRYPMARRGIYLLPDDRLLDLKRVDDIALLIEDPSYLWRVEYILGQLASRAPPCTATTGTCYK